MRSPAPHTWSLLLQFVKPAVHHLPGVIVFYSTAPSLCFSQVQEIEPNCNLILIFHSCKCSTVFIILPKTFLPNAKNVEEDRLEFTQAALAACVSSAPRAHVYVKFIIGHFYWNFPRKVKRLFVDANCWLIIPIAPPIATLIPHLTHSGRMSLYLSGSCLWVIPRNVAGKWRKGSS
jgi:hypothetical protein